MANHQRFLVMVVILAALGFAAYGALAGADRLNSYIATMLHDRFAPSLVWVNLPAELVPLAENDLHNHIAETLSDRWTDPDLPRRMAGALMESGWVSNVDHVRRMPDGRFLIKCMYRLPTARVRHGNGWILLDSQGFRLPGVYTDASQWRQIQGLAEATPQPGKPWLGDDVLAAIRVLRAIETETFAEQIRAVNVENYKGRRDKWRSHVELVTDQPDGRIRWGSAPGFELEENTITQKLGILRENFRQTGRIDAHYPVIDVSTFPDRFTWPLGTQPRSTSSDRQA
ncbi:MAG: hypothetical protein AABZ47_13450 [Planctomycetota bacterium]